MIVDEVVVELKELIGLTQPGDGDAQLKILLKNAANYLSRDFRQLFTREDELTITDGRVQFPKNINKIRGVWIGDTEIQPVRLKDFYKVQRVSSTSDVIKIEEKDTGWEGQILGVSSGGVVTVQYDLHATDIHSFPDYFRRLIYLLTSADYYLWKDPEDPTKESRFRKRFEEEYQRAIISYTTAFNHVNRRRSQYEADWDRALHYAVASNEKDIRVY